MTKSFSRMLGKTRTSSASYESRQATLLDVLNSQRSSIAIERLIIELSIESNRQRADLQEISAEPLAAKS